MTTESEIVLSRARRDYVCRYHRAGSSFAGSTALQIELADVWLRAIVSATKCIGSSPDARLIKDLRGGGGGGGTFDPLSNRIDG